MNKMRDEDQSLDDKFGHMNWLLVMFNSDISGSKSDKEIIADFVMDLKDSSHTKEILEEGRQFLALDELPIKWIRSLSCRRPCVVGDDTQHYLESTEENYRIWIKWMIEEVEREAKRQGKL